MRRAHRALLLVAAGTALGLFGCSGQGKYTAEHVSLAERKMTALKAATEFSMAEQAFLAGELEKAERKLKLSLSMSPDVAATHVLMARVLLEEGRVGEALGSLRRALEIDGRHAEAHYYTGVVSERLRQPGVAFTHFAEAAQSEPMDPQYTVAAAEMLVDLRRYDEAEDFLRASQVADHAPAVKQLLGHIAMIRGLADEAADRFTEAALLSPNDPAIREDLVAAQVAAGRYAEAEAELTRMLASVQSADGSAAAAERRDLHHLRAMCLIALGRPLEARQVYRDLTAGDAGAGDVEAWIGLGRSCFLVGDVRRLGVAADRVRAIAPARVEGPILTALWHRVQGEPDAALAAIERSSSEDPETLTLRALVLADLGRFEDARHTLYAVLDVAPGDRAAMALLDKLPERDADTFVIAPTDG
jgi:tetratricopeptide (TPR) repeat protein